MFLGDEGVRFIFLNLVRLSEILEISILKAPKITLLNSRHESADAKAMKIPSLFKGSTRGPVQLQDRPWKRMEDGVKEVTRVQTIALQATRTLTSTLNAV